MKKKTFLIIMGVVFSLFLLLVIVRVLRKTGGAYPRRGQRWRQWLERWRKPASLEEEVPALDTPGKVVKHIKTLTTNGGRVGWSPQGDLIAFDRKEEDGYFDVWLMKADGSEQKCLTCSNPQIPKHNGNPEYHPSGEYLVFQAEDPNLQLPSAQYTNYASSPGIGLNNNLWVMTADGSKLWQLTFIKDRQGTLHPHFSSDGKRLLWAEIIGPSESGLAEVAIKLADFSIEAGQPYIKNIQTLYPNNLQLYEVHQFSHDGQKIIFSGIEEGQYFYDMENYILDLTSGRVTQLTDNEEWDEQSHFTPDGEQIIWTTSQGSAQPKADSFEDLSKNLVKLDLWIMNLDASGKRRLTFLNDPDAPEYQAVTEGVGIGDFDISPDGKTIVAKMRPGRALETIILIELGD